MYSGTIDANQLDTFILDATLRNAGGDLDDMDGLTLTARIEANGTVYPMAVTRGPDVGEIKMVAPQDASASVAIARAILQFEAGGVVQSTRTWIVNFKRVPANAS